MTETLDPEPPQVLAIIPARGGSKGVPRKNLIPLGGKPLMTHMIMAAMSANSISRIVVSTDDDEIAAVATRAGADVVVRPDEISGDLASSEDAVLHALDHLKRFDGYEPDIVAFLQATAPLTTASDIDGTVALVASGEADSALAAAPFHYFLWRRAADGNVSGINHDSRKRLLRQVGEETQYLECGSVYAFTVKGFIGAKHRFFGRTRLHIVPGGHVLEVDDPNDVSVAAVLMAERRALSATDRLPKSPSAVVFDFDGVFTDNSVIVLGDGREAVVANRSDGLGIANLRKAGLPLMVLSSEENQILAARCKKLRLPFKHGLTDKLEAFHQWLAENNLERSSVVYVGNDSNDVSCLMAAGCGVVVADAHKDAIQSADIILERSGGHGAVREISDMLISRMRRNAK